MLLWEELVKSGLTTGGGDSRRILLSKKVKVNDIVVTNSQYECKLSDIITLEKPRQIISWKVVK